MYSEIIFQIMCLIYVGAQNKGSDQHSLKIVNGKDARPGEFPFQVSIQNSLGYHMCSGTILNENFVLTSGYCIENLYLTKIRIVAGSLKLSQPKSIHEIKRKIYHDGYEISHFIHNLALLQVENPFVFGGYIRAVRLPQPHQPVEINQRGIVSGWGSFREGSTKERSNILQKTKVSVIDEQTCRIRYEFLKIPINHTQFCAYDSRVWTGPCNGDAGDPLSINGTLIGVTSYPESCGSTTFPGLYTKVSEYVEWLYERMNSRIDSDRSN